MLDHIEVFEGGVLHFFGQYLNPVLNLVIDGTPVKKYKYWLVFGTVVEEVDYRVVRILRSQERAFRFKPDGSAYLNVALGKDLLFIISGEPIFTHIKTANKHVSISFPSGREFPKIKTTYNFNERETNIKVQIKRVMKHRSPNPIVSPSLIDAYMKYYGNLDLSIEAEDIDGLYTTLEEEIGLYQTGLAISRTVMTNTLQKMYKDPSLIYFLQATDFDLRKLPTQTKIQDAYSTYNTAIQEARDDPFSISSIEIEVLSKPMIFEEYRRMTIRIELIAFPPLADRELAIVRKPSGEDELFAKLAEKLEGVVRHRKGREYISMTYSELLDLGNIFPLGEAYRLNQRIRWVV